MAVPVNKEEVDFPETGYKWNQLGKLAQKFYEDYKISWHEKWTLGRMIQFNTSSPYANAKARIRKWKKSHNI
ncbi:ClbS/DfsB family four-helix bundle protein [Aliarcobacter butzleri]